VLKRNQYRERIEIEATREGMIHPGETARRRLLAASIAGILTASMTGGAAAYAQTSVSPGATETVVVTGSRVARDGFEAPTPLTVMGVEEMNASPSANLAEFVNTLPSVVGSTIPQNSNTSISSGAAGVNALNLRSLGSIRTLVLIDGQRSVGSILNGTVDVNNIPQALVQRVEVVTGGASAAYGSDAVSGVVNFILDKQFTGLRTEVEGGMSARGDNEGWRARFGFGTPFAGGRGHVLLSGEMVDESGIFGVPRSWNRNGRYIINNPAYTPTNGEPERLLASHASLSGATAGGIITNTALRGIAFGPGGSPYQFNYGVNAGPSDPWMVGGEWRTNQFNDRQTLNPAESRQGVFSRVSFGLTENTEIFAQASWNQTESLGYTGVQFNQGNVIIRTDNAFLPDTVRTQAQALGITQFNLGTMNADLPVRKTDNERDVVRYVVGLDGTVSIFGDAWQWNAYYQRGISKSNEMARDISNNARLALASDAVFHPDTGAIVCRSTLTDPTNGCVPFNRMGIGVNSQAALDYVLGNPERDQRLQQDVVAASITGEPFATWAGPVSVAFGGEWREEQVSGYVQADYQSGWFVGNFLPNFGKYHVTEGFLETVVPLAAGAKFADTLDLNAAVRLTDYSTSGEVTTWKVGTTWAPIRDLRFRATISRDIRAPNLQELFASGTSNTNNVIDPFNNNQNTQYRGVNRGNPNLLPEEADQYGFGVVLEPRFLSGFSASVDYYKIDLSGAIGTVSAQEIVDRCFDGNQSYCASIVRGTAPGGASVITEIGISPFNLASRVARGVDVEASYRIPVANFLGNGGDLTFRVLGTRFLENYINDGISPPTDSAGSNTNDGPPKWIYRASVAYRTDPMTLTLMARGVSSGVYDTTFIECTSGCPTSTVTHRTINDNRIEGAIFLDANLAYRLNEVNGLGMEIFLNVRNLLDKDPPIVAPGPAGSAYGTIAANPTLYDQLGRLYRAGIRIRM